LAKKFIEELNNEELLSAIKRTSKEEGFFLEERTAQVIKESLKEIKRLDINATFDEYRNDNLPNRGLDVLAIGKTTDENSSLKLIACEVKSGGNNSKLILIRKKVLDERLLPLKINGYQFGDRNEGLNQVDSSVASIKDIFEPLYCYTGDFYIWNEDREKFKKSNTSLYKASEQLFHGIEGFIVSQYAEFFEDDLIGTTLIPIIVTNVDIYVAQNEGVATTSKVDFAILENNIRFRCLEIDPDPDRNFINKVFPYCWVVKIDVLSDFLKNPFRFNQDKHINWQ
jgi:hypothetical protein